MQKIRFIFIGVILLIVIFILFVGGNMILQDYSKKAALSEYEKCEKLEEPERYSCEFEIAIKFSDSGFCKNVGSERGVCYWRVSKCEANLYPGSFIAFPICFPPRIARCGIDLSSGQHDDRISKPECFEKAAEFERDASICEKTGDSEIMAAYTKDKDLCYSRFASSYKDERICEKVGADRARCYYSVALEKRDLSLCDKVSIYDKNSCIGYVTNDPVNCGTLNDSCLNAIVKITEDKEVCEKAVDKYRCLAIATRDFSLCTRIDNQWGRDHCYLDLAELLKEASICSNIEEKYDVYPFYHWRDDCYSMLAQQKNDKSICKNIVDNKLRKECYLDIIVVEKN